MSNLHQQEHAHPAPARRRHEIDSVDEQLAETTRSRRGELLRQIQLTRNDGARLIELLRPLAPIDRQSALLTLIGVVGAPSAWALAVEAFGAAGLPSLESAHSSRSDERDDTTVEECFNLCLACGASELIDSLLDDAQAPLGGLLATLEPHVARAALSLLQGRPGALAAIDQRTDGAASQLATGRPLPAAGEGGVGHSLAQVAERHAATLWRASVAATDVDARHPAVDAALARVGSGEPLPSDVRVELEATHRVPLDRVRIHLDPVAQRAAAALNARAFTVGEDIFFAAGQFSPASADGRRLIAHEVVHVVQAYQGRIPSGGARVSQPSDPLEREAESLAAATPSPATETAFEPVAPTAPATNLILRDPAAAGGVTFKLGDVKKAKKTISASSWADFFVKWNDAPKGSIGCVQPTPLTLINKKKDAAGLITSAQVSVSWTSQVLSWKEFDSLKDKLHPLQIKSYQTVLAAMEKHEAGHVEKDKAVFTDAAVASIAGMSEKDAVETVLNPLQDKADLKNKDYDDTTDNGVNGDPSTHIYGPTAGEIANNPVQRDHLDEARPDVDDPAVRAALANRGGGARLTESATTSGADVSAVRVHTDSTADAASRALHARAFTVGNDIFFGSGNFAPDSSAGRKLLIHELTHVAQHQQGRIAATTGASVSKPSDALEVEARSAAEGTPLLTPAKPGAASSRATAGSRAASVGTASGSAIHRFDGGSGDNADAAGGATAEQAAAQAATAPAIKKEGDDPDTAPTEDSSTPPTAEAPSPISQGHQGGRGGSSGSVVPTNPGETAIPLEAGNAPAAGDELSKEATVDLTGFGGPVIPVKGMKKGESKSLYKIPSIDTVKSYTLFSTSWSFPTPVLPILRVMVAGSVNAHIDAKGKGDVNATWDGSQYVIDAAYAAKGSANVRATLTGGAELNVVIASGGVGLSAFGVLSTKGDANLQWAGMTVSPGGKLSMPAAGVMLSGTLNGGDVSGGVDLVAWVRSWFGGKTWRKNLGNKKLFSITGTIPFGLKLGPGAGPAIFSGAQVTKGESS